MPSRRILDSLLSALKQAPMAYGYLDAELVIRYHNAAAAEMMGSPGADLVGLRAIDTVSAAEAEVIGPHIARALAGEAVRYERASGADGTRSLVATYIPQLNDDASIEGVHVFLWDATDQRRSEQVARSMTDRFRSAFDSTAVGMAIVGPDGSFVEVNNALCGMLGHPREALCACTFQDLTHPEDLELDLDRLHAVLSGEIEAYTIEKRYVTRTGSVVWGLLSVAAVRNPDGSVAHFVSQIQDISSRKRAEAALHNEHELAQVTLQSIGDAVITCDAEGRVTYLNPVAETLTGWTTEQAKGRPINGVFDVRDPEGQPVPCPVTAALEQGETVLLDARANLHTRSGEVLPVEDSAAPIRDRVGRIVGGVLVFHDVSEQRAMHSRLEYLAHHDLLTTLPNRGLFKDRLSVALNHARRSGNQCAVLFCDLDRFKAVNDLFGHAGGDEVLKTIARRLEGSVREGDTVCRWAGDEFAVLLPDISSSRAAAAVAERIVAAAREPIHLASIVGRADTGLSVGISLYPDDGEDPGALMSAADAALYQVKRSGRNGFAFHHADFNRQAKLRARQELKLRQALASGSFEVHYQPRVSLHDGRLLGAEALVRIRDGDRLIYPGEFIGVAEDTGLINDLSAFVFRRVCEQVARWKGTAFDGITVAINMSPIRLKHPPLVDEVTRMLAEHRLQADGFELEITEGVLVEADGEIVDRLTELHALGFNLALDDFGTGFSNLSYLRKLPVDSLKIDRSFVSVGELDATIIEAIVGLGRALRKHVVVEGVETAEQETALRQLGCDEAQGFLYAPGLPAEEFEARFLPRDNSTARPNLRVG